MPYQQGNVLAALAQRRKLQTHDTEPVEQIFAEPAVPHFFLELAVRRGDDTYVHGDRLVRPHATDLPLFENPEQLRLEFEGELAELVEKDRPPLRHLEQPLPRHDRAGEAPFLVTEQFALDQRLRNRTAVEDDERLVRSLAHLVDRARHDLFARPGLALDDDGGARRSDLLQNPEDLPHLHTPAHDVAERFRRRRTYGDLFVDRLKADLVVADAEDLTGRKKNFANTNPVHERSIGTLQVDSHVLGVFLHDSAVVPAHGVVLEDDVVVVHRADGDDVLVEDELALVLGVGLQQKASLSQM